MPQPSQEERSPLSFLLRNGNPKQTPNHRGMRRRAYTMLELVLATAILAVTAFLIFPRGTATKDRLTSRVVAEELVSRLRRVRQLAISKHIPVALAIPRNGNFAYSDTAYVLEGDINPRATEVWKIEQDAWRVVFFVGNWNGPTWAALPQGFTLADWWDASSTPPQAHIFAFNPQGKLVSNATGANGAYRILVAHGLTAQANNLQGAGSPWTVWASPAGEIGIDQGVYGADQTYASSLRDTAPGATLQAPPASANRAPRLVSLKALPDVQNPNAGGGKLLDVTSCLTLELRVQDDDGDPPFFTWSVGEVLDPDGHSLDPASRGGRYGNSQQCRMEWSTQTKEWVGRVSWTPAITDKGGCSYALKCEVDDHRGGVLATGFPVQGYLKTTKEPWILYKTLNKNNHWELWRMTMLGREHQRVVGFENDDVRFGQWSPAGDEVLVGTNIAVYRAKADGSGLRRVSTPGKTPVESCCLSPKGDALFYVCGGDDDKQFRRIDLTAAGQEIDVALDSGRPIDQVFNLSAAVYGNRVVAIENFYRHYGTLTGTTRRDGVLVIDPYSGDQSGTDPAPPTLRDKGQNRGTTGGTSVSEDGSQLLWGTGPLIYFTPVTWDPATPVDNYTLGAPTTLNTGLGDVHHPRYTWDKKGMVFANGRGLGARVWCIPDLTTPGSMYQLTLPPENVCADEPTIGPPF